MKDKVGATVTDKPMPEKIKEALEALGLEVEFLQARVTIPTKLVRKKQVTYAIRANAPDRSKIWLV